jgi:hypothetical protein
VRAALRQAQGERGREGGVTLVEQGKDRYGVRVGCRPFDKLRANGGGGA